MYGYGWKELQSLQVIMFLPGDLGRFRLALFFRFDFEIGFAIL